MYRCSVCVTWCGILLSLVAVAYATLDEPLENGTFDSGLSGWTLFPAADEEEAYVVWDEETGGALLAPYGEDEGVFDPPDTNSTLSQEFYIPAEMVLLSFDLIMNTAKPGEETDVITVSINENVLFELSSAQVNQAAMEDDPLVVSKYIDPQGLLQYASYQTSIQSSITQFAGANVELVFNLFNDNGDNCVSHVIVDNIQVLPDTTPPTVTVGDMWELWPPNHKYVTFNLSACASVMDNVDGEIDLDQSGRILSIYSDEPEDINGNGDGNTEDDIIIVSDSSFMVLRERQGGGDGRVYGVTFEIADQAGNVTQSTFNLGVPHDQSGDPPVNSGAANGYTVYNN